MLIGCRFFCGGQNFVEDRLNECCDPRRAGAVDSHRDQSAREPPAIRPRVAQEAVERGHAAILRDRLLSGRGLRSREDGSNASATRRPRWCRAPAAAGPIPGLDGYARRTRREPRGRPAGAVPTGARPSDRSPVRPQRSRPSPTKAARSRRCRYPRRLPPAAIRARAGARLPDRSRECSRAGTCHPVSGNPRRRCRCGGPPRAASIARGIT